MKGSITRSSFARAPMSVHPLGSRITPANEGGAIVLLRAADYPCNIRARFIVREFDSCA
ncbi:MAG: hypothetical protein WKG32_17110 [Gemmatimonadaceae bacterium]